jgi:hypothetical protein
MHYETVWMLFSIIYMLYCFYTPMLLIILPILIIIGLWTQNINVDFLEDNIFIRAY